MEQLERKLANQKLLDEEEKTSKVKGGAAANKVTQAQIQETKVVHVLYTCMYIQCTV